MTKKESLSFNVPGPIREAFNAITDRYSVKEKWALCSAAILLMVEAGEKEQHELFKLVRANDHDDESMQALVDLARGGDLRVAEPPLPAVQAPVRTLKSAAKPVPGKR